MFRSIFLGSLFSSLIPITCLEASSSSEEDCSDFSMYVNYSDGGGVDTDSFDSSKRRKKFRKKVRGKLKKRDQSEVSPIHNSDCFCFQKLANEMGLLRDQVLKQGQMIQFLLSENGKLNKTLNSKSQFFVDPHSQEVGRLSWNHSFSQFVPCNQSFDSPLQGGTTQRKRDKVKPRSKKRE